MDFQYVKVKADDLQIFSSFGIHVIAPYVCLILLNVGGAAVAV